LSRALYGLGHLCARHRFAVLGVWLVIVAATVGISTTVGKPTSNNLTLPGTGSTEAQELLEDNLPKQANGTNPVVMEAGQGRLDQGANAKAVEATVRSLQAAPHVSSVISPLAPQGAAALSKDGQIGYASVSLNVSASDLTTSEAEAVIEAESPAVEAGLDVATGGYLGQQVSKPATESSELIGLIAAVIILLFAFGTAAAMSLPIVTAMVGLATGLSAIGLLGHTIDVPTVGPTLGTMLGLGVGIDYALFIVTRHRGFMEQGHDVAESAARAVATAGGAVLFAGGTVVIALVSLAVAKIPLVSALGYSAAVVVLIAVCAAITLLPAVLAILGRRIDSLRVPFLRQPAHDDRPHGWARWARAVGRRPWLAGGGAVLVLAALALPVLNLQLGQQDNGQMPKSTTTRQAYDLLTKGFGPGINGPFLIAVDFGKQPASSPEDKRLLTLEQTIGKTNGVAAVSPATLDESGGTAVFSVIPTTAPSGAATEDLVRKLRDSVIPGAVQGTTLNAYVGGQTAAYIDLADRISEKLPLVIAVVLLLSFLLLTIAFHSVVVPLTAGLMNLLSVGAAYGVLTFVFQEGHGASLIGLPGASPIVSFVPLLMFAILFGLSMDYQVFLLSRMQEHYRKTGDNHEAVVDGLAVSARVITSAALIMVAVYTSFILNGDPTVKQFGLGLAAAVAIDATIVRCLLVPATMVLLGDRNWWMPKWLDRIVPRVGIEGDEFLRERDAELAAAQPAASPAQSTPSASSTL
jgi:RND superfamily putative drug exporter